MKAWGWLIVAALLGPIFVTETEAPQSMPAVADVAFAEPGTVKCFDYSGMKGQEAELPGDQFLWAAKAGRGWLVVHSDLTGIGLQYSRAE